MISILYTDSAKILAALGLSSDDISDDYFTPKDLDRVLGVDLFSWLPTHASVFQEDSDIPATTEATFRSDCLVLYSTHFCASRCADAALSIFSKESDGQSEYNRPTVDTQALSKSMLDKASYYRESLLTSLQADNITTRVQLTTVVTPSYDPVTG